MKGVIRAANIVKSLGEMRVLDGVSLEAYRGKVVVIMGPNGSGKSTLLKILALLMPPDEGCIEIDGLKIDFVDDAQKKTIQRRIAYLPQKPPVFTASVHNNIYLPLRFRGVKREEAKRRTERLLALVRLKEYAKMNAHKLSGGQKQLLAIARTLALEPEIMLLDEPTSSLAPNTAEFVRGIIKEYVGEKNCYTIVVSHNTAEAKKMASILHVLVSGKIRATFSDSILESELLKWI